MRMQSILVRPYVLDCLTRFEEQRANEEMPQKKIILKSTLKRISNSDSEALKNAQLSALINESSEGEAQSPMKRVDIESDSDSKDSVNSEKSLSRLNNSNYDYELNDTLIIRMKHWLSYEKDQDRIEMPEYK